uniref:Uncharacterized protein n=1 Tax=Chenopodium quinoa TaxID=63459 RepID=A0A803KW00_CHEQI
MASNSLTCTFVLFLIFFPYLITSQQPYAPNICPANSNTTSVLGYNCNGVERSCQSFLIYRTQPPYNTVSSIASLLSVNASQVSAINSNISENMALANNTEVIVPVTCSCSGRFYQANTTHVVQTGDNYYLLANTTYGGLTTCKAIRSQKISPNIVNIFPNERLTIPLRCACPTRRQLNAGIRYLMSFVVQFGNQVPDIAIKFGADVGQTLEANQKSEQDIDAIYPYTTLLVPLHNPPNGSQMEEKSSKKWEYFGVGLVAGFVFLSVSQLFIMFLRKSMKKKDDPIVSSQSFEAQEKAVVVQQSETETESLQFLESISKISSLRVYSFKDLQAATKNFRADHWIKGSVYKGTLNGDQVAIKKMEGDVSNEISVLIKINHFNLIRLLGVCFEDGVWYFVNEFAGNGPLNDWIYQDNPEGKIFSWGKRLQVACDVATGAKIAGFGLARPVRGSDGQFTLTIHIVGTKGYLAPEYLDNGIVSPMLDVYASGVLLLEMVTGKDVASLYEGIKVHLSEVLNPVLSKENGILNVKKFIDSSLGQDYPADVLILCSYLLIVV